MTTFWAQCCTIVPADIKADEEVVAEPLAQGIPAVTKKHSVTMWKGARQQSVQKSRNKSEDSRIRAQ